MNNTTKGILLFASGLIFGAAGGGCGVYFYCKKRYEKELSDYAAEQADYYHKKYNDIPVKEVQVSDESPLKEKGNDKVKTEEEKSSYEEVSGIYKPKESDRVVTDYKSISDDDGNNDIRPNKKKGKKKKPYVISHEIWDENEMNYDKQFIKYYEADNVLIDEETDSPVDIMNQLGESNFNDIEDYEEPIFIANDQFHEMYMVTVEPSAWAEEGL